MKSFLSGRSAIIITCVLSIMVSANLNWPEKYSRGIIRSDASGYYAYLPALFIYKDIHFNFYDTIEAGKYYNEYYHYDYRAAHFGYPINKYYCGTALAQLPFFLIAHGISHITTQEPDGYSYWYRIMISVSALFYLLLGCIFSYLFLKNSGISEFSCFIALLCMVFGTNLFYYAIIEPGMSHVYSFAFISFFVFSAHRWMNTSATAYLFGAAFALGIILLIRPVNGLVLFSLPFLAGSANQLVEYVKKLFNKPGVLILILLIPFFVFALQLFYYYISTGDFRVYSYGNEKFDFLNPHIFDILFSFRKGLFLYTPMYLFSFSGLIYLIANRLYFKAISFIFFFLLITFVFSSWWNWYYGGSFSSRVYVEFIPFFMLLLAYALDYYKNKIQRSGLIAVLLCVVLLCQFQIYQYRYGKIHWENMNRELYFNSFKL